MKNKIWIIIVAIILIVSISIGCFEQATTVDKSDNIFFESEVVKLYNYSLNFIEDEEEIIRVEVQYLFINIVPRDVVIQVTAEFYDKDDNLLGTGPRREIELLRGYREQGISPANIIPYDNEENVAKVEYVKLTAVEI
jgi:hypothetical protein